MYNSSPLARSTSFALPLAVTLGLALSACAPGGATSLGTSASTTPASTTPTAVQTPAVAQTPTLAPGPTSPPPLSVKGAAAVVRVSISPTDDEIYAFVVGSTGELFDDHWDGAQWRWEERGGPPTPGVAIRSDPAATWWYSDIRAFVIGADGHLYDVLLRNGVWSWEDFDPPPNTTASGDPVVTVADRDPVVLNVTNDDIFVAVRGANGHLFVLHGSGGPPFSAPFSWNDLGRPATASISGDPGIGFFRYPPSDSRFRVYVFAGGADGHLYVDFLSDSLPATWTWADQGMPPNATVAGRPGVGTWICCSGSSTVRLYAFVRGSTGHLYVNFWDGARWLWADQGTPPTASVSGNPGVASYAYGGVSGLYAFVRASDGHLWVDYWNNLRWQWADQGAPITLALSGDPGALDAQFAGMTRLYAFATGASGHLHVDYWDTTRWQWADQGVP